MPEVTYRVEFLYKEDWKHVSPNYGSLKRAQSRMAFQTAGNSTGTYRIVKCTTEVVEIVEKK